MDGLTVTWQGNTRPVDAQCRGGHRPDKPCANPVAGVMHLTGGYLEACKYHMDVSMDVYRRTMDGRSWELDADTVERYDPASQGWVKHHGPYRERFPEVWNRSMCAWREFWVRADERLVVEWEIEGVAVRAVFLNGHKLEGPVTGKAFDAVWVRVP